MDAPCKIQGSIHVFSLVNNMCPGKWVHINLGWALLLVERYLICLNDNLLFASPVYDCFVYKLSSFFSPLLILLFPLTFYLVRSLQAINSSATTCGFWLSLMRASILRT